MQGAVARRSWRYRDRVRVLVVVAVALVLGLGSAALTGLLALPGADGYVSQHAASSVLEAEIERARAAGLRLALGGDRPIGEDMGGLYTSYDVEPQEHLLVLAAAADGRRVVRVVTQRSDLSRFMPGHSTQTKAQAGAIAVAHVFPDPAPTIHTELGRPPVEVSILVETEPLGESATRSTGYLYVLSGTREDVERWRASRADPRLAIASPHALAGGAIAFTFALVFGLFVAGRITPGTDARTSLRRIRLVLPAGLRGELEAMPASNVAELAALRDALAVHLPHVERASLQHWRASEDVIAPRVGALPSTSAEGAGGAYRAAREGVCILDLRIAHLCELPDLPARLDREGLRSALELSVPWRDSELAHAEVRWSPADRASAYALEELSPDLIALDAAAALVCRDCRACGLDRERCEACGALRKTERKSKAAPVVKAT